jgi:DNA polymerase-3 subunit delta'
VAGFITRGQPAAVRQASAMIAAGLPHALLLVGPRSVGKTTLAVDLAASLLCTAGDPAVRPCRGCRACRLVDAGHHPDVHRLAPDGAGGMIGIDAVRALITELALLAAEGGERVAIIESAHRLTDDAQNALLKTLEEPPSGVTLILCAEDEDRLLPTIHSRAARIRLGTLSPRNIEGLLVERGDADAPLANRLARLAEGRPGLAIAYARSPEAVAIRGELARSLLDLSATSRALRLVRAKSLLTRAGELAAALTPAVPAAAGPAGRGSRRASGPGPAAPAAAAASAEATDSREEEADTPQEDAGGAKRTPAERRRAAVGLIDVWRETTRDLALAELGGSAAGIHEPDLLEELIALSSRMPPGAVGAFLARLDRTNRLLDANANPELAMDVLLLAWPHVARAA